MIKEKILRDDAMVEIAHHTPKTAKDLGRTRGLSVKVAEGSYGEQLLGAVKRGLDVPDSECPQPEAKPDLPRGLGPVTDLLKVLLKMKSEDADVATKLLASSADIELIAAFGEKSDGPVPDAHFGDACRQHWLIGRGRGFVRARNPGLGHAPEYA